MLFFKFELGFHFVYKFKKRMKKLFLKKTLTKRSKIVQSLVATHALSGCGVPELFNIGKKRL